MNTAGSMQDVLRAVSESADVPIDKENDIKEYIDAHVKKVTKLQLAEDR